ncbi:MAG: SCP2 sterol-binding domain-containing protein [Proteobacteria bacterium]|nr:SCP2 sterol-binding domain-containing protein [Pseudomonadota bacterium]
MPQIELSPDVEDGGMASMIADIIKGNLQEKPKRKNDFIALNGNIYMNAEDAEVDMTLVFNKGSLMVHNGKVGNPQICIATDSGTLLDLANINVKFGLPYYFDSIGWGVITKLLTGKLKIKGLVTHPIKLTRFTKLMSVR